MRDLPDELATYKGFIRNRPAMVEVGRLAQITKLFTDTPPAAPFPALLEEAGTQLVVAD